MRTNREWAEILVGGEFIKNSFAGTVDVVEEIVAQIRAESCLPSVSVPTRLECDANDCNDKSN